jgi:uncharacterized integral membrane protein
VTTSEPRPTGPTGDPLSTGPGGATGPTSPGAGPVTPPPATPAPATTRGTGRTVSRTLAAALLVFVTVVLVLFVMFNTQRVEISLVFTDVRAPLVVALLIAAVLGGLVIGLLDAVMAVRRRKNR